MGESCGSVIPNTGLILNNFLGEEDVCPDFIKGNAGKRLMTMCTPTISTTSDSICVMGSGGSTRIRSAILSGLVELYWKKQNLNETIYSPRYHVEPGIVQLEMHGRNKSPDEILSWIHSLDEFTNHKIEYFEEPSMFFGGLHSVRKTKSKFEAIGDLRRDGIGKIG